MAIDLTPNDWLENGVDAMPVTTVPLTMSAWFHRDITGNGTLLSIADQSSGNSRFALTMQSGPLDAWVNDTDTMAKTSASASNNRYNHALGVFAAANDRKVYLNGGSEGTNTVSKTPTGVDRINIGRLADSTPNWYWDGRIAEVAIWNVALNADERAMLAAGFSALFVRRTNLVFYAPLINEAVDIIGGLPLTIFGAPPFAAHPRIIYPLVPAIITVPVAAGGVTLPIFEKYYRSMRAA